jgi:hypothetical protein
MRKQIIWLGVLLVLRKNFPSWQQPKSLLIDHKPTCLFFLIGKLMFHVVSSKIHTYIWAREEWSSYQEFWFSLISSFATNLLKCRWTTSPLFFLWILWSLGFEEPHNGAQCCTAVVSFHCSVRHFHVEEGHYQIVLQQR